MADGQRCDGRAVRFDDIEDSQREGVVHDQIPCSAHNQPTVQILTVNKGNIRVPEVGEDGRTRMFLSLGARAAIPLGFGGVSSTASGSIVSKSYTFADFDNTATRLGEERKRIARAGVRDDTRAGF